MKPRPTPSTTLSRPISNLKPVHKCKLSVAAGEAIHRNWAKGVLANGISLRSEAEASISK